MAEKYSYQILLSELTRAQLWSRAESLLSHILNANYHDSRLVSLSFSLVISSYGKAGMLRSMERLFSYMLNEGCTPTASAFNALISVYGKALQIPDMEAALLGMVEPNVVTWSCLADAYRKAKLEARVDIALENLSSKPQQLDAKAYGVMIDIYARRRDFESVERCRREMVNAGFKLDVSAWTSMVTSYGSAKGRDAVDEIWRSVGSELEPDVRFYLSLLDGYRASASFQKMERVFSLLKQRHPGKAELLKAFNIVIDAYGSKRSIRKMEETLDEMENDGVEPDSRTYTALIAGYARARMVTRMESTFLRMRVACCDPDEFVYNVLIDGYASLGMVREAEQKLVDMSRAGLKPGVVELTSVLNSYKNSREHRSKLAERFFQLREEFGVRPDEQTMAVFLAALKEVDSTSQTADGLIECVRQCDSSGAVRRLLGDGDDEKGGGLWKDVEEMLVRSKHPAALCDSLIDVLSRRGFRSRALKLMDLAWIGGLFPRLESVQGDTLILDLHGLSVKSGEIALELWLSRLDQGSFEFKFASIVTGWGRTSRACGNSPLRNAVEAMLFEAKLPFQWDQNLGKFILKLNKIAKLS